MSSKKLIEEQFDVVVVGAGPSGMMAAIRAAQKGARVALVDKKEEPGKKLLMAGNGRCNLTQDQDNVVELSNLYKNGRFLLSAFNAFRPGSVQEFFAGNGVPTKVEKNGRVFPLSDRAEDVLGALTNVLKENNITFLYKSHIVDFSLDGENKISKIKLKKRELFPKNVIIAVGGKSYPATGSMGDGYQWAAKMGHKIIEPMPVLVPIKIKEDWVGELQGVSAGSVSITVYQGGKKKFSNEGDLMFTHYGFSGPLALNMSRNIAKLVSQSDDDIKFILDLKPYLNFEQLDEIILTDFERNADKKLSNCLHDVFSPKLLDFVLRYSGLDMEKHAAKISRKERHILVNLVKNLSITFDSLFGFEMAMVTSGGVSTREIDSRTMGSKIVPNLYFAGEIIDVDGPTGGYNLQMCWSTGYLAGESAAKNLK
ncbi:MAG: FAD dependent oxidoreductase [Parcubacteria group bacterium GW2011_GWC1_36_108]|nr:MAG: FAD dependent oxidoreductase [Parcubacteria group bacterium GW2011_GWC1_36_108]KKQ30166.1 MAG: HI0933 family protein [Candidatus Moranbacteria bacterium GW2011_GWE1_37_24]HBU11116.1 aminoacetone oxidase family FAD-binding enzyme [Candidatus Moranbacteria bacterium]